MLAPARGEDARIRDGVGRGWGSGRRAGPGPGVLCRTALFAAVVPNLYQLAATLCWLLGGSGRDTALLVERAAKLARWFVPAVPILIVLNLSLISLPGQSNDDTSPSHRRTIVAGRTLVASFGVLLLSLLLLSIYSSIFPVLPPKIVAGLTPFVVAISGKACLGASRLILAYWGISAVTPRATRRLVAVSFGTFTTAWSWSVWPLFLSSVG